MWKKNNNISLPLSEFRSNDILVVSLQFIFIAGKGKGRRVRLEREFFDILRKIYMNLMTRFSL